MPFDATLAGFFAERPEVTAAYLFGSQAKGTATAGSDIDVAILLDLDFDYIQCASLYMQRTSLLDDHIEYRLELMAALETLCRRPVDVVILNQAPLVLRHQILRHGKLIGEGDHRQRVEYEVRTLFEYFDFKPTLDLLHAGLTRRIKQGNFAAGYRGRRDPLGDARRARERFESLTEGHV